jgi:hypothetical protein
VVGTASRFASTSSLAVAGGTTNIAIGAATFVSGGTTNVAIGVNLSVSVGFANLAQYYGEWVLGLSNTVYIPTSAIRFSSLDHFFNVGNGTGAGNKSDVMTILKIRFASLPVVINDLISAVKKKSIFTKEYIEANYLKKNIKFAPKNSKVSENLGDTRVAFIIIYTCIAKDT